MYKVLYPKDLVAEYLPGYEDNKEFMGLFNKYFVKTVKDKELLQGKEYYALSTYLYNNLKPDFNKRAVGFKENQKRALSFVKNYKKLETYINRSKNVKRPEAVANREKLKLKMITYWPMARVLENLEDMRKREEREENWKKGEERRHKMYMEKFSEEPSSNSLAKSLRVDEEKKALEEKTEPMGVAAKRALARAKALEEEENWKQSEQKRIKRYMEKVSKEPSSNSLPKSPPAKKATLSKKTTPERLKDTFTMWDQEHSLTIPPEDDDEKAVPVKRLEAKIKRTVRANRQLELASTPGELLQLIPFTLFGVSRKEMDPKHLKLFEKYMISIFAMKEFNDFSEYNSDWFRANYPKLQKYMVQNLSFTESEATKFFKKFNAFKDKMLYTDTHKITDTIKFFSYLPTYSALIELEERKYLPANKALPETTIKRKDFDKVSRKSLVFTRFALSKVFGGAFNNDKLFVTLFKDYIDTYIFDWDRFWDQWRFRNTVELGEKGGMDNEYLDLVKYIKYVYEPLSKKQRKNIANYVKNLERKLDVFTKEGDSQSIKKNNEFRLLSQTLMIYAPFADAFPTRL